MPTFAFRAVGSAVFLAGALLIFNSGHNSSDALKAFSPDPSRTDAPPEATHNENATRTEVAPVNLNLPLNTGVATAQPEQGMPPRPPGIVGKPEAAESFSGESIVAPVAMPTCEVGRTAPGAEAFHDEREPSISTVILVDNLEVAIPVGQQLPVSVMVSARNGVGQDDFNEQQRELADRVTADFAEDVAIESTPAGGKDILRASLPTLQSAAHLADERFRALFGHDIYNREIIRQHQ